MPVRTSITMDVRRYGGEQTCSNLTALGYAYKNFLIRARDKNRKESKTSLG